MTNLAFVLHRCQLRLAGVVNNAGGSEVIVHWMETTGGEPDPVTGALVGGVQAPVSGVLRALGAEEPARTVLRQFAEIQAGDLILETDPNGVVALLPGRSQTLGLDDLAGKGVRFEWGGRFYAQAEIGEELAQAWNVIVAGRKLYRTLLLRRAT